MIEWMKKNKVPLPELVTEFLDMNKASLIELSKKYPQKERYVIIDLVEKSGKNVKILFLPVAHCELNPIELIWAFVKGKVSELNKAGGSKTGVEPNSRLLEACDPEFVEMLYKGGH
jgi:hypothetical protein